MLYTNTYHKHTTNTTNLIIKVNNKFYIHIIQLDRFYSESLFPAEGFGRFAPFKGLQKCLSSAKHLGCDPQLHPGHHQLLLFPHTGQTLAADPGKCFSSCFANGGPRPIPAFGCISVGGAFDRSITMLFMNLFLTKGWSVFFEYNTQASNNDMSRRL